jgi:hypothetical protein
MAELGARIRERGQAKVATEVPDANLGRVASGYANPVATSRLTVRCHRPVPLRIPLLVSGAVEATEGRRVTLRGTVCTEQEPDVVLAEAEGWFVRPRSEQATAMFSSDRLHGSLRPRSPPDRRAPADAEIAVTEPVVVSNQLDPLERRAQVARRLDYRCTA